MATELYYLDDDAQVIHAEELKVEAKEREEAIKLARIERAKREEELAKIKAEQEAERKWQAKIKKNLEKL